LTEEGYKRKLAAILSADARDYCRHMGVDESGTVRAIQARFQAISKRIAKHRGRVVDSSGDNLLAEFASVVDAVQCAVAIQEEIRLGNAELSEERRIVFRIGIHVGDVIEEEGRIYGEGVNIAARVEQLAEGGAVFVSGAAYEQIRNKLPWGYEDLGEHAVKNIPEPVRVYKVLPDAGSPGVRRAWLSQIRRWKVALLAATSVLIVAAVVMSLWNAYLRPPAPPGRTAPEQPPPLPDEPSIAVLPFENLTGDPSQDYLADGLVEDITTSLSSLPRLFVISRSSTFTYKGKPVKVQQVSREMGVRYVLEGSVQKSGDRVRINTQLIDATTGEHVWAERFDREIGDIFRTKDEIVLDIAGAMAGQLTDGDQARLTRRNTDNLKAWEELQRGYIFYERFNPEDNLRAREHFRRAIGLDPEYVNAWVALGYTYYWERRSTKGEASEEVLRKMDEISKKSMKMDPSYYGCYVLRSLSHINRSRFEESVADARKAVELEPGNATVYRHLAFIQVLMGEYDNAAMSMQRAMRLRPYYPLSYLIVLSRAYQMAGRHDKAIEASKMAAVRQPKNYAAHLQLAVIYAELGREEEMRAEAAEMRRLQPDISGKQIMKDYNFKDPKEYERLKALMIKAGVW